MKRPYVLGFSGYARAGKNTAYMMTKLLLDEDETGAVIKVSFADALKKMAREHYGWNGVKDEAGRRLLQDLGVGKRQTLGPGYWVDLWAQEVIRRELDDVPPKVICVTDVRFPNELDAIHHYGGQVWRLIRPGTAPVNAHVSETALDNADFDRTLVAPTLDDLLRQVKDGLADLGLLS